MGPRHVLSFCACTTVGLTSELLVSMGPSPLQRFLAHITSCLAQESIDYIGSSPHLCVFFHAKQRLYDQTYKSVWVPDLICGFWMQNSDFRTRLTSLYGSQTSSVVLSTHNCVLSTRINRLYWFQLSPVVLCKENSVLSIRITSLRASQPSCVFFACKSATFGPE